MTLHRRRRCVVITAQMDHEFPLHELLLLEPAPILELDVPASETDEKKTPSLWQVAFTYDVRMWEGEKGLQRSEKRKQIS